MKIRDKKHINYGYGLQIIDEEYINYGQRE